MAGSDPKTSSRPPAPVEAERLVIVTGFSGAGKSTALQALADEGYYCVEHLPPSLVAQTVEVCLAAGLRRIALGMDVRVAAFLDSAERALQSLAAQGYPLAVIFLDASDEVLVRRFSETRRPHPLLAEVVERVDDDERPSGEHALAVLDGVRLERARLGVLRNHATVDIDTSLLSAQELRRRVVDLLHPLRAPRLVTRVLSFGFKYGAPPDVDLLFDVRFLDNPHFVAGLRELAGTDRPVRDFVLAAPGCAELLERVVGFLLFALPRYEAEGKSYLTVGIGCTGGRHRSVALAVEVARRIVASTGRRLAIVHRDINRRGIIPGVTPARASSNANTSGDTHRAGAAVREEDDG